MADNETIKDPSPNIMFVGFADNRVPEMKEVKSKDYVLFGAKNDFPDHLLYLYNKSSNHNAIVDGKVTYITGNGFPISIPVNQSGEQSNKILKKLSKDIELFGGFRLEFIWNNGGSKATLKHIPFQKLRTAKDGKGYFYRKDWSKFSNREDEPKYIPAFDQNNRTGAAIFAYDEYRPGCGVYPLPGYLGALNDIETDVEISKYNLSVIKQGMFSSKMVVFNTGEPNEEAKRKIEKGIKDKFTGSENAGKFWLVFNTDPTKAPQVIDMSTTDLDKLFDQLKKTTQAFVFTGHQVTSPMLFGVKTEGELGGRSEIMNSYEIFKNTYVNDKQKDLEEVFDFLAPFIGLPVGQKIQPVEPIGLGLDPVDFKEMLPKEWVFEKLGIDIEDYPEATAPTVTPGTPQNPLMNSLSGRQNQQLQRILRQYKRGQITKQMAEMMLRKGYDLQPEDINTFLSFEMIEREDEVAEMFTAIGKPRQDYTVVKSKPYKFGEAELFADLSQTDSDIVNLIGKDKRITPAVIAKTLHTDPDYISSRIRSLEERGVLTKSIERIGIDTIIEHSINQEVIDTRPPAETIDMYVRYSYEPKPGLEPVIDTTRPFCKKLIELDRLYSRSEIESISQRVGYSVWDRKGGFWGHKDECRHRWVSNIVIKKRT